MARTDAGHSCSRSTVWMVRRLEEALFMAAGAALALPLILPFA